jgi:hypothetical protein
LDENPIFINSAPIPLKKCISRRHCKQGNPKYGSLPDILFLS